MTFSGAVLVGNSNVGKTTLFNTLTGGDEHTGNWAGVTVRAKSGDGGGFTVTDLPGIYSLGCFSMEERAARDYLSCHHDRIFNVVECRHLAVNLYLTLQLVEAGYSPVVLVNMLGELEKRGASEPLLALLHETDEELVHYALNLIGSDPRALPRYAEMLSEEEYDEHVKDALADLLKESADKAKERILPLVKTESKPYALEILSRCKQKDDRVFEALLSAFRTGEEEEVPLYAGYLAAYGDERALPALQEHIAREDIDFVTFQELKFAIEALGGEYTAQRDFSEDESYKKIMAAGAGTDIFGSKKNG